MIEHTEDISVVAITGLVDKLYIEQVRCSYNTWFLCYFHSSSLFFHILFSSSSLLLSLLSFSLQIVLSLLDLSFSLSLIAIADLPCCWGKDSSRRERVHAPAIHLKGRRYRFRFFFSLLSFSFSLLSLLFELFSIDILPFFFSERGVVCFNPTKFRSSRFLEFTSKPSTELPLTHHIFRFDFPVEQPGGEKIFSRGCIITFRRKRHRRQKRTWKKWGGEEELDLRNPDLTFLGGDDGWACRIKQNQVASMYSVRVLCPQLLIISTSTKPYAIIYLSGKVAFMNSTVHKFALLLRPINEEPADWRLLMFNALRCLS